MAYFTNINGERINTVTKENLADFLQYIKNDRDYDTNITISDDVTPNDFFAGFEKEESKYKENLASIMEKNIRSDGYWDKYEEEFYELAKTHPEAFGLMYRFSNCQNCEFSTNVETKAKNSTFSDNLYFINALVSETTFDYKCFDAHEGNREDIHKLPEDKEKIVVKLFASSAAFHNKNMRGQQTTAEEDYSYRIVDNVLNCGHLLNYEPGNVNVAYMSSTEVRRIIDENITIKNIADLDKKFIFDGNHVNKDFLKLKFESQLEKAEFVQTEGEQKVHNAKQMRDYVETRNLVLDAAEKVIGKYIPNSRDEERTNTQKFKALMESFYNKPYEECPKGKVVEDYLLSAAYRDINEGNAAKLDGDSLRLVVDHDKDGFWLNKINEKSPESAKKIIQEMKMYLNNRQKFVADVIAPEFKLSENMSVAEIADNKFLSTTEKKYFLDKFATSEHENLLKAQKGKILADEYKKISEEYEKQRDAKYMLLDGLENLQNKYADIVKKFDNGVPNDAEMYLTKENMEKALQNFPNCQEIDFPEQGKLPFLFGRKNEENRRMKLAENIREFNGALASFQNKVKNRRYAEYADISAYKGKLLEADTKENIKNEKDKIMLNIANRLNGYSLNMKDVNSADERLQEQKLIIQEIENAIQKVVERKKRFEKAAKDTIAPQGRGKDDVRESNKQIADTLEEPVTKLIEKVRNGR